MADDLPPPAPENPVPDAAAQAPAACPKCGWTSPPGTRMRFCGNCGAALPPEASDATIVTAEPPVPVAAAPAAPSPVISPPAPAPVIAIPADPLARERERDRLMTLANVQRMRGQITEAVATVDQVLLLAEGAVPRDIAPIHELRGDLLATLFRWEDARDAYATAHEVDPERAAAERKFATMLLRMSEMKGQGSMADAMLRGDNIRDLMLAPSAGHIGKRKPGLAMLLSAFVPGFGQFYNGQLVKGLLCLSIFVLALVAIRLSPDSETIVRKLAALVNASPVQGAARPVSPLLWFLLLLSGVVWVYSFLDAATSAAKSEEGAASGPGIDKTGWEV